MRGFIECGIDSQGIDQKFRIRLFNSESIRPLRLKNCPLFIHANLRPVNSFSSRLSKFSICTFLSVSSNLKGYL